MKARSKKAILTLKSFIITVGCEKKMKTLFFQTNERKDLAVGPGFGCQTQRRRHREDMRNEVYVRTQTLRGDVLYKSSTSLTLEQLACGFRHENEGRTTLSVGASVILCLSSL